MTILKVLKLSLIGIGLLTACGQGKRVEPRTYSEVISEDGLAGAAAWLKAQDETAETAFLVGMTEALLGVEHILQVRYATYSGELPLLPGGQAEIAYNPNAEFDPAFVEIAMLGALEHFAASKTALDGAVSQPFAVEVDLALIWFDIDANGARNEGEGALRQVGQVLGQAASVPSDDTDPGLIIRFDTADADWLAAYVHLASASAEMILSFDPTSAIRAVFDGNQQMRAQGLFLSTSFLEDEGLADTLAVVLTALDSKPDPIRTRATLDHLKKTIIHNENFWSLVSEETDNDKEWLPNARQTSAFGVEVTEETALAWQAVLAELSDVLHGRKLIPHWRFAERDNASYGINLESLLTNPGDFDLVLMIHGAGLAPHFEAGDLADQSVWADFARTVEGRGGIFALWLN